MYALILLFIKKKKQLWKNNANRLLAYLLISCNYAIALPSVEQYGSFRHWRMTFEGSSARISANGGLGCGLNICKRSN